MKRNVEKLAEIGEETVREKLSLDLDLIQSYVTMLKNENYPEELKEESNKRSKQILAIYNQKRARAIELGLDIEMYDKKFNEYINKIKIFEEIDVNSSLSGRGC